MFAAFCVLVAASCEESATQQPELGPPPYADTDWPSTHAGPSNDDYVPTDVALAFQEKWTALEGASTLAAPTVGPEGNIYQTTGLGKGSSNLHAFDADGNLLWETEAWNDAGGFDSCAILQGAVIDTDGDLYVSDCNQFWAFHSDGAVKWVIDLPPPPEGAAFQDADAAPVNSFITGFFTRDGSVGGVTAFGSVVIVDRATGELRYPITELPGSSDPNAVEDTPPTFLLGGLADRTLTSYIYNVALNTLALESIDTPAVSTETGRIFVSAAGSEPGAGAIYGIDLTPSAGGLGQASIAFETRVAGGGGSSPALSPDLSRVLAGDGDGNLNAIDAETGELIFSTPVENEAASPSVGPDGKIYLIVRQGLALNPDGSVAWEGDYADLVAEYVPEDPMLGAPVFRADGVLSVTDNAVVFPLIVNYVCDFCAPPREVPMPVKVLLLTVDPQTGELIEGSEEFVLRGTNEAFTVPLSNGSVLVNDGSFTSSLVAPLAGLVDPIIEQYGLEVIPPTGGLQVLESAPAN
jgi:outer membrane protein assembly factor BamB